MAVWMLLSIVVLPTPCKMVLCLCLVTSVCCIVVTCLLLMQQVYAHIPLTAHSTYYKDIIGNISSSETLIRSDNVSVRCPCLRFISRAYATSKPVLAPAVVWSEAHSSAFTQKQLSRLCIDTASPVLPPCAWTGTVLLLHVCRVVSPGLVMCVSQLCCLLTLLQTEIVITLRYPLMGGWKTDFVLGEKMAAHACEVIISQQHRCTCVYCLQKLTVV